MPALGERAETGARMVATAANCHQKPEFTYSPCAGDSNLLYSRVGCLAVTQASASRLHL